MVNIQKNIIPFLIIIFLSVNATSQSLKSSVSDTNVIKEGKKKKKKKKERVSKIDLSHWKVTLPIGDPKPINFEPPEILDYANNPVMQKYMYNDPKDGALVFYTEPGATTQNTKYARTELREQMEPGNNNVNWTFAQGGKMRGKLKVSRISKDKKGKYHRTIIMQIHGRLTNEQRERINKNSNDAPPILKIFWKDGKVRVKTKILKDPTMSGKDVLRKDSWEDDEGFNFKEEVGFKKFTLEVKVSKGKMVISLNDNEFVTYNDSNIGRWGIFENYFKAGNYFTTNDENAFAEVKYYSLEVSH